MDIQTRQRAVLKPPIFNILYLIYKHHSLSFLLCNFLFLRKSKWGDSTTSSAESPKKKPKRYYHYNEMWTRNRQERKGKTKAPVLNTQL